MMSDCKLHLSIENWLEKLDLLIYKPLFRDYNGVEEILGMSERQLKNLGINNGSHRARVVSSLTLLKDKYDKISKHNQNSPSLNGNNLSISSSNVTPSISPIRHISLDKAHSGVHSWPSTKPSSAQNTMQSSPRLSMDGYSGTEATAVDLKKALEKELSLDSSDLKSHAWYHGTILRQRAEELVTHDGDFLVRDCISQPGDFVITCKWNNMPLHFIIKKVIIQPYTVYERIQYCFEKDSFDTIPDYITYYVGSKCPLSENSGVIISRPVNRIMPLSYYASRYGVQCQITYVAKALEKIPSDPPNIDNSLMGSDSKSTVLITPKQLFPSIEDKVNVESISNNNSQTDHSKKQHSHLVRVGSDPMINSNPEKKTVEARPNSGLFKSDCLASLSADSADKPPPKPSRVPSKRCLQKPVVMKRERKPSDDDLKNNFTHAIPIPGASVAHSGFKRQISETRFSFLDRPSVSSCSSTPDEGSIEKTFTIPSLEAVSLFDPQRFRSDLLTAENSPLEAAVLSQIRNILLSCPSKLLACHLTRVDLEIAKNFEDTDLGLGVTSGLELSMLPQGDQMQKDLLERTESIKLFIAVLILTTPEEDERVKLLNKLIEIAIETKTVLGNLFGFTSIMLGLTLPEILGLHSTWSALRYSFTDIAFVFETKLRPTFKALHNATGLEAPNICLPYILSLILILQQYISVINCLTNQPYSELIYNQIMNFSLPGSDSSDDFGLQLIADHLENGRNILQQIPVFQKNGQMSLKGTKYNSILLDVFRTEFHLRLLWGFRGSLVCHDDRHNIFKKVIHSLYQKCSAVNS